MNSIIATIVVAMSFRLWHITKGNLRAKNTARKPYPSEIPSVFAFRGGADSPRESLAFARPSTLLPIASQAGAVGFVASAFQYPQKKEARRPCPGSWRAFVFLRPGSRKPGPINSLPYRETICNIYPLTEKKSRL